MTEPGDATYQALCGNHLTAEVAQFLVDLMLRVDALESQVRALRGVPPAGTGKP